MIPNMSRNPKQGDPWQNYQNTHSSPPILINQAPASSQIPPDPETSPKPTKYTSPNGIHSQNQGHPWQNFQPSPTSLSSQTKQASASTQIPLDPETPPKPTKFTIPHGSHDLKQGIPGEFPAKTHFPVITYQASLRLNLDPHRP